MKRAALLLAIVTSILLSSVLEWPASLMMANGHILTMDSEDSIAVSVLIEGQYIVAIGSRGLSVSQVWIGGREHYRQGRLH